MPPHTGIKHLARPAANVASWHKADIRCRSDQRLQTAALPTLGRECRFAGLDQKARLSELARQHAGPVLEALAQVALWNPLTSSLEPLEASY